MAEFLHSIVATNQSIAADGDVTYDLPVNPLSLLLLHLNPLNNSATIANYRHLAALLSAVDTVQIAHRGASIINARGDDLMAAAMLYHGYIPIQANGGDDDNEQRSLVLPLYFGRKAYSQKECLPETKRGDLTATITWDIADTGFDGLRISIEAVELPGATPTDFEMMVRHLLTPAATGDNDLDLPLGQIYRALLLFGTTAWAGATPASTIGQIRVLLSNKETRFVQTDWEVSKALAGVNGRPIAALSEHLHAVNAAGAGEEDTRQVMTDGQWLENYSLLDFDPTQDDTYSINTKGASRFHLRMVNDAADALRVLPVEKVAVTDFF